MFIMLLTPLVLVMFLVNYGPKRQMVYTNRCPTHGYIVVTPSIDTCHVLYTYTRVFLYPQLIIFCKIVRNVSKKAITIDS